MVITLYTDKRYKWHMHMTKADGSRGSGSDDKAVAHA